MPHLMMACIAAVCCLALFQPASQATASEPDATGSQSVTLVPIEPVPDAADGMGEVSLSDFGSVARDISVRPVSLKSTVSLKSMADEDLDGGCDSSCDDGDCGSCMDCYSCQPCVRCWVRADYLLWWTRGSKVPPLVTTSTDQNDNGILGQPTTSILYGDWRKTSDARSAPRITMGYWFDCCQTVGIQLDYFNLGQANNNYDRYSDGETLLARPFTSVFYRDDPQWLPQPASELVAKDGVVEGRVRVDSDDYFQSWGIMWRRNICCYQPSSCGTCGDGLCCGSDDCCDDYGCACDGCGGRNRGSLRDLLQNLFKPAGRTSYRVDFIAGYRNYRLDDNINITENLISQDLYHFDVHDSFRATNEFHGGELGLITQINRGRWSLELLAKMALGNNSSIVNINGTTDVSRAGDTPIHYDEGFLALQTNSGRYHHDQFVVIPQFGIELGYDLTCSLRAYCGYNFLYWAHVARAAEQIDTNVNASYVPPVDPPHGDWEAPEFSRHESDFWAQGLNFGLELQF
jgi:hypothetical protein